MVWASGLIYHFFFVDETSAHPVFLRLFLVPLSKVIGFTMLLHKDDNSPGRVTYNH